MKINDSVSYKQSNHQKMKETGSKGPESWCHICIEQGPRFVMTNIFAILVSHWSLTDMPSDIQYGMTYPYPSNFSKLSISWNHLKTHLFSQCKSSIPMISSNHTCLKNHNPDGRLHEHRYTQTQPFCGPLRFCLGLPQWAGTRKVKLGR